MVSVKAQRAVRSKRPKFSPFSTLWISSTAYALVKDKLGHWPKILAWSCFHAKPFISTSKFIPKIYSKWHGDHFYQFKTNKMINIVLVFFRKWHQFRSSTFAFWKNLCTWNCHIKPNARCMSASAQISSGLTAQTEICRSTPYTAKLDI